MLLLFLNYGLHPLIPAAIAKIFQPTVELIILIGITTKEAKAGFETHPVDTKVKTSMCSI